jgi:signal peptidase II
VGEGARGVARAAATAAVVVALDQATKQIAIASVDRGERANVFFGLDITNSRNTGVAFGAFQDGGAIVAVLIGVSLTLLIGYFALNAAMPRLWLPVGLLVGGALGNLADRAREGAVIDFIDPSFWPAFNLADTAIVIGVLSLLYVVEEPRRRTAKQ